MKICFIVSARCTNTVTMDHFPKLAKFPGLFCHCCFRQVSFLLGDKKVVAGCWFLFFARGGRGQLPPSPSLLLPQVVYLCSSRQWITMGTCKTKAIPADLGIFTMFWHYQAHSDTFRHNQPYSRTSQLYSDIFCVLLYCVLLCTLWNEYHDFFNTPWTQDVNWTYIKCSEDIQFMSCVQGTGLN